MKFEIFGLVEGSGITGRPFPVLQLEAILYLTRGKTRFTRTLTPRSRGATASKSDAPNRGKVVLHAEILIFRRTGNARHVDISGTAITLGADRSHSLGRLSEALPRPLARFSTSAVCEVEHRGRKVVGSTPPNLCCALPTSFLPRCSTS